MGLSRRDFLTRVGQAGGFQAAFLAMQGLGLTPASGAETGRLEIAAAPGSGNGVKLIVLGAGIAGLVAAYELRALGYDCTVLEARERPGGRNWTVRGGDTVKLLDGTLQRCTWADGHYQNFGPARLPSIHTHMLGYCRKLGVELQVEVNMTRSEKLQNDAAFGGQPQVMRQVENDARGRVSELLAKSIAGGGLDQELTAADRDRMLTFLRTYGPLDDAGKYVGSDRAGYAKPAGAGDDAGTLSAPLDMHTLLDANFWQGVLFDEGFDQQATMFQPVGGMDRIPHAFAKALGTVVRYGAPVTGLAQTGQGVRVTYTEHGTPKVIEAAYCICAMPLTTLRRIPNGLSAPYKKVVEQASYAAANKIAWESRRFWEQDYNIYGGLEFTATGPSPIWFPSAGMFSERGVLVSGYGFDEDPASAFARMPLAGKYEESRKSIERLHPGHGRELEKPVYVGWGRVEWNEGSWIRSYEAATPVAPAPGGPADRGVSRQTGQPRRNSAAQTQTSPGYETLIEPDGRIIFAGDHVSHIVAWQEGAAVSALRAVQQVSDQVKAARLAGVSSEVTV